MSPSPPNRSEPPVPRRARPAAGAASFLVAAVAAVAVAAGACAPDGPGGGDRADAGADAADREDAGRSLVPDASSYSWLPRTPDAGASSGFWDHWGDGKAEMSGYRVTVPRYGEMRDGELVLVYVTEPHDRRRWIKDDDVGDPHRVEVMKLNVGLQFQTGVYPYSVLTSVFSPVADWGRERFSPAKIVTSAQEWCGSYRHQVWPGEESFRSMLLSYFAGEGERVRTVDAPPGVLYEDALLIQLRELDGPFAGGGDWRGEIVPSLWRLRAGHAPARPVPATITRRDARRDGTPVTRFVLEYRDYRRTYDVERAAPHRVLGWSTSEGAEAELLATERLPYWRLNAEGDESVRARLGLEVDEEAAPPGPGGSDPGGPSSAAPPPAGGC